MVCIAGRCTRRTSLLHYQWHPLVNWPWLDPTQCQREHVTCTQRRRRKKKVGWRGGKKVTGSNALISLHSGGCKPAHTHTSADRLLPATGQVNRALIKPWSEFELEHYPLRVINAAAPWGGQSGQQGEGRTPPLIQMLQPPWKLCQDRPRVVSIPFADEDRIIWIKWTSPTPKGERLRTGRGGKKVAQKSVRRR